MAGTAATHTGCSPQFACGMNDVGVVRHPPPPGLSRREQRLNGYPATALKFPSVFPAAALRRSEKTGEIFYVMDAKANGSGSECLYAEGVKSHSPRSPRIAAHLGLLTPKTPRKPQRGLTNWLNRACSSAGGTPVGVLERLMRLAYLGCAAKRGDPRLWGLTPLA